ncbi:MAG: DEDD exonuclease domain-containing protein [Mycobacterium sp.]|nr:DEDD exonuclease domain-containing protein [Mycobacterium sp.]
MGQLSFSDVDPFADPTLRETTFVVVDLETTGGRHTGDKHDSITEIGAVKVRGGEVLGEFATLVDPGRSIPPQIVALTGITSAMVYDAPPIEAVLPAFLEFCRGAVLVAHNAGFDIGFLRAAAERNHLRWPKPPVLCTVRLARRALTRDEAPSVRLSALARLFGASTTPTHRALDDARATVDVLHGLIERVGNQGVHTYTELRSYLPDVTPAQRSKRHLAKGLPPNPGVYLFRGPSGEVLYVGTSINLRRRVSQYFSGADPRTRIKEMASLATAVDHVECAHDLEAGVRELRLLAAHAPPYNRRSKFPRRWWWLTLTDEDFPRFAAVRAPRGDSAVGPFRSRGEALEAAELIARFTGVRTCTTRLGRSAVHGPACPEREVSPCPAVRGIDAAEYAAAARDALALIDGRSNGPLAAALSQVAELAERKRYETAARLRDRAAATIDVLWRGQRLRALASIPQVVAAKPDGDHGWHLAVIRHGQLAAAGVAPRGVPPMPVVDALCAGAQSVLPPTEPSGARGYPLGGALVEETALLTRWLARPGVRIVQAEAGYCSPLGAAGRWSDWAASARSARLAYQQATVEDIEQATASDLLGEAHPTREQLLGSPGVDRFGGTGQSGFPRRRPLGAAG